MAEADKLLVLSAKVTALGILVESLLSQQLAKGENAQVTGRHMVDDILIKEKRIREDVGESDYAIRISDILCSTIDRCVTQALLIQSERNKG